MLWQAQSELYEKSNRYNQSNMKTEYEHELEKWGLEVGKAVQEAQAKQLLTNTLTMVLGINLAVVVAAATAAYAIQAKQLGQAIQDAYAQAEQDDD